MKLLAIAVLLAIVLPVNGQKESPKADSQQNNPEVLKATSPSVEKKDHSNNDTKGASDDSKSYLSRLFSPENLPNIGLFIAGIIGIIVAVKTLKTLNKQTKASIDSERARIIPELFPMATHYSNAGWHRSVGGTPADRFTPSLGISLGMFGAKSFKPWDGDRPGGG